MKLVLRSLLVALAAAVFISAFHFKRVLSG